MPAPAHTRCTFSGIFGSPISPAEIWAMNINTEPLAATTPSNAANHAEQLRSAYNAFIAPVLSSDCILTRVRVAAITGTGHVGQEQDGTYQQGDSVLAAPGGLAASPGTRKPPQSALVLSLLTARPGATGKGRVFLPWQTNHALDTDFRITEAAATDMVGRFADFIEAIAQDLGQPVVVASSKGYLSPVTAVRVGRTVDTMRSRRSQVPEGYVTTPITNVNS